MASTPSMTSSTSSPDPSLYLHLAPPYTRLSRPDSNGTPTPPSSSNTSQSSSRLPSSITPTSIKSREPKAYTESDMRKVVLEYLLSSCFPDSAKAFAREVQMRNNEGQEEDEDELEADGLMEGVEATPEPENSTGEHTEDSKNVAFAVDEEDGDDDHEGSRSVASSAQLRDARLRQSIQEAILLGRITQATSLINTHYPSVLAPSPPSTSTSASPSKLSPLHPQSPKQSMSTPRSFFVLPPSSSSSSSTTTTATSKTPSAVPIVGSTFGSWSTSLSPEIISLNLQLQSFVELMRTGHATSSLSTPSTPTGSHAGVTSGGGGGSSGGEDTGMSSSIASLASSNMTTSTSLLSTAISSSQALLTSIQALPPSKDKEQWERECVDVCGLLAYKDLTNCPVRGYLEMSRREGLAEMVNAAILQRNGKTPMSVLSLAARQATAVWSTVADLKVEFLPPPLPPPFGSQSNGTTKTKGNKIYPQFDFHRFVNSTNQTMMDSTTTRNDDVKMSD